MSIHSLRLEGLRIQTRPLDAPEVGEEAQMPPEVHPESRPDPILPVAVSVREHPAREAGRLAFGGIVDLDQDLPGRVKRSPRSPSASNPEYVPVDVLYIQFVYIEQGGAAIWATRQCRLSLNGMKGRTGPTAPRHPMRKPKSSSPAPFSPPRMIARTTERNGLSAMVSSGRRLSSPWFTHAAAGESG